MVVGNMGTARKMDYTMMGNSVNLAARLEGVNKQYGTWKLISQYTYGHASNKIFVRKLDQVRVVGIHEPVQLYELLDEKREVKDQIQELVDIFHKGLDRFQLQDWKGADEFSEKLSRFLLKTDQQKLILKGVQILQKIRLPKTGMVYLT